MREVYLVLHDGEAISAYYDKDMAESVADSKNTSDVDTVLSDWGNNDPTDNDVAEASFQSGFDGDYSVESVDLDEAEYGTVYLADGSELDIEEVEELLESSRHEKVQVTVSKTDYNNKEQ